MRFTLLKKDEIVEFLFRKLFEIIYENLDSIQYGIFEIRPSYGYKRFYLNRVDSTYGSLQILIHFILFEEHIYEDILSVNQYEKCRLMIQNRSKSVYYPDGNSVEDLKIKESFDFIYNYTIFSLGWYMVGIGLDIRYIYRDYLDLFEHGG